MGGSKIGGFLFIVAAFIMLAYGISVMIFGSTAGAFAIILAVFLFLGAIFAFKGTMYNLYDKDSQGNLILSRPTGKVRLSLYWGISFGFGSIIVGIFAIPNVGTVYKVIPIVAGVIAIIAGVISRKEKGRPLIQSPD